MPTYKPKGSTPDVVKRAFYLAWQACGVYGMGWLQDRGEQDEEVVWNNIQSKGDYPGDHKPTPGEAYADYVFGRMMKMRLRWDGDGIHHHDMALSAEYESWCRTYPSYQVLLEEADRQVCDGSA